jgi:hypothetical protein
MHARTCERVGLLSIALVLGCIGESDEKTTSDADILEEMHHFHHHLRARVVPKVVHENTDHGNESQQNPRASAIVHDQQDATDDLHNRSHHDHGHQVGFRTLKAEVRLQVVGLIRHTIG